ncbi:hypothetical protein LTR51_001421 [Lithohypha guttulata]|nr:hypothetical protein LTR51_001421 [Lithohypha guttulata]
MTSFSTSNILLLLSVAPRMAHNPHDHSSRFRGLKLDTHADEHRQSQDSTNSEQKHLQRPGLRSSTQSEDTITRICATPPIEIPQPDYKHEDFVAVESASSLQESDSFVDDYLKERETAITFSPVVTTSTGHRHSILEPPGRAAQDKPRGRALAQALSDHHNVRPHSESDKSHYDPRTGRHLPQYTDSPPKEEPRIGEARFPLLQQTVDTLARQYSRDSDLPQSMTSEAIVSPVEGAVITPSDNNTTSPIGISPSLVRHFSSSYDSPRVRSQRKASERWRDGEAATDFFSRAGSLKKSDRDSGRRASRRDTLSSTKSPRSAASSFLRGFSVSSGADTESTPLPVDAEGATIGDDYVLGKQIGYGGFSIFREVKQMNSQTGEQRTLAVKIVKKQIEGKSRTENENAQADFEHEVDLWRLLNHKHILSLEAVYDLEEATFCFVPLNVGGTLFDVVSNNRQGLPQDLAANYSYQLASALRYLHLDARVVHRDVKLENCLVETTNGKGPGLLRLCDFGLAEWISSDSDSAASPSTSSSDLGRGDRPLAKYFGPADSSSSAFAGGSLEYAAPEILKIASSASGNVHSNDMPPERSIVSSAVDIWAMGVCIFALINGRRPFQDAFQPRVVMAILAGDWNRESLKEKASDEAYRLVKACLNMDASRRPGIGEVFDNPWFDDARSVHEGSDAGSESGRANGWRL